MKQTESTIENRLKNSKNKQFWKRLTNIWDLKFQNIHLSLVAFIYTFIRSQKSLETFTSMLTESTINVLTLQHKGISSSMKFQLKLPSNSSKASKAKIMNTKESWNVLMGLQSAMVNSFARKPTQFYKFLIWVDSWMKDNWNKSREIE